MHDQQNADEENIFSVIQDAADEGGIIPAEVPPNVPEELEEKFAVTDIMIALVQNDYDATEEECKKIFRALKEQGCPLTSENIVAAYEDLDQE